MVLAAFTLHLKPYLTCRGACSYYAVYCLPYVPHPRTPTTTHAHNCQMPRSSLPTPACSQECLVRSFVPCRNRPRGSSPAYHSLKPMPLLLQRLAPVPLGRSTMPRIPLDCAPRLGLTGRPAQRLSKRTPCLSRPKWTDLVQLSILRSDLQSILLQSFWDNRRSLQPC